MLIKDIPIGNGEAFCVSCILFVIKLEGDFTPELVNFNVYVRDTLKLAGSDLFKLESQILRLLPDDFGLMIPLSEFNAFLATVLENRVKGVLKLLKVLDATCINFYIENVAETDVFSLSVSAFFACTQMQEKRTEFAEFLRLLLEKRFHVKKAVRLSAVKTLLPVVSTVASALMSSTTTNVSSRV